jgi:hypothetical protein
VPEAQKQKPLLRPPGRQTAQRAGAALAAATAVLVLTVAATEVAIAVAVVVVVAAALAAAAMVAVAAIVVVVVAVVVVVVAAAVEVEPSLRRCPGFLSETWLPRNFSSRCTQVLERNNKSKIEIRKTKINDQEGHGNEGGKGDIQGRHYE